MDSSRPLNRILSPYSVLGEAMHTFCCPADQGIGGESLYVGTGHRTVCRAFGTSYRANAMLFHASLAGLTDRPRGIRLREVQVAPSRLLVLGDPVWYEVYESTGRDADWHAPPGSGIGNVLFLDGAVRFQAVRPRGRTGPIAIEPRRPNADEG